MREKLIVREKLTVRKRLKKTG